MARSHHRKKHKEHLRQFKQTNEGVHASRPVKGSTTVIFTLIGAAVGFAIGYFAGGDILLMIGGLLIGGLAGFYIGGKIDTDK